jgi:hypothetical protein
MGSADVTLYAEWFGPGYKTTYTAAAVSFIMAYVPGGITFPTGTSDLGSYTVSDAITEWYNAQNTTSYTAVYTPIAVPS